MLHKQLKCLASQSNTRSRISNPKLTDCVTADAKPSTAEEENCHDCRGFVNSLIKKGQTLTSKKAYQY